MRDWGPKMLVFPDLGSQVEVAQKFDPETPRRPWNNTMYPEKGERSIVFTHLYGPKGSTVPKWRGLDLRLRKGDARRKLTSGALKRHCVFKDLRALGHASAAHGRLRTGALPRSCLSWGAGWRRRTAGSSEPLGITKPCGASLLSHTREPGVAQADSRFFDSAVAFVPAPLRMTEG